MGEGGIMSKKEKTICWACGKEIKDNIIYKCGCSVECGILICEDCVKRKNFLVVPLTRKEYKKVSNLLVISPDLV